MKDAAGANLSEIGISNRAVAQTWRWDEVAATILHALEPINTEQVIDTPLQPNRSSVVNPI